MPRIAKELSALEITRIKAPGNYPVGGVAGLTLQVSATGSKSWVLRTMVGSARREIGLGGQSSVTLAGAREAARAVRAKIAEGIDPVAERQAIKSALSAQQAKRITFEDAAKQYVAANEKAWKNAKHRAQWMATIETYAFPAIGKLEVGAVDKALVLRILEPIWTEKPETASRLRGRIEKVLDWAKARGFREGENPAAWKGNLAAILPAKGKVKRVTHHAALDYRQIGAFMAALRQAEGTGARALEFGILCAARSGEVRNATWREIDSAAKLWIIPAERMKAGREHRIPLTDAALTLLESLPRLEGTELIFPSSKGGALSDMTLTAVVRRMDDAEKKAGGAGWRDMAGEKVTVHGFRSCFRDWAGEATNYPREVTEHALAHQLADKAEAAYQRGDLLEKRRLLMKDWAGHCAVEAEISSANITPIRRTNS